MSLFAPFHARLMPQSGPLSRFSPIIRAAPSDISEKRVGIPVVLHHGLGFGTFRLGPLKHDYFPGIDDAIARRHPLIMPLVHPVGSIARRARQLKQIILREMTDRDLLGRRMVIIGHSLGGLDARYMITHLGMAEHVAALVTITTPHLGSPYADWCLRQLGRRIGGLEFGKLFGLDVGALVDLTTDQCARFNETTPCMPGVRYYSVSASRPEHFFRTLLTHAHRHVYEREGPNDGLVSVKSATWQKHLGTWNADHWQTINRRRMLDFTDACDISPEYVNVIDQVEREIVAA